MGTSNLGYLAKRYGLGGLIHMLMMRMMMIMLLLLLRKIQNNSWQLMAEQMCLEVQADCLCSFL